MQIPGYATDDRHEPRFTDGELCSADGVGFVLSSDLPCTKCLGTLILAGRAGGSGFCFPTQWLGLQFFAQGPIRLPREVVGCRTPSSQPDQDTQEVHQLCRKKVSNLACPPMPAPFVPTLARRMRSVSSRSLMLML